MKQIFLILALFIPFCVASQLDESFNGTEVSSINPWLGDTASFKINAGNQLQLNAEPSEKEVNLCIPSAVRNAAIWKCWVKLDFKATSNNYARIFLWSSHPVAAQATDAYYVRVGYTQNEVALCQRVDGKEKVLISTAAGLLHTTSVSVKVIADPSGTWSLQIKEATENEYKEVGSRSLKLSDKKGYFLLNCKFTKNVGRNKMYFDTISIHPYSAEETEPEEPDIPSDGPELAPTVEVQSATEIIITLDTPMNMEAAVFTLSGIGDAEEYWMTEDYMFLKLVFLNGMKKGTNYTLSWTGIQDMDGVSVKNGSVSFTFGKQEEVIPPTEPDKPEDPDVPEPENPEPENPEPENPEPEIPEPEEPTVIKPSDLIINEVLFDPLAGGSEYIELYNRSAKTLNASLLFIATRKKDGTLSTHYPLSFITNPLEPKSCVLLTKSVLGVTSCYDVPETGILYEGKLPVLANTGASIVLATIENEGVIDELTYSPKWHSPLLKNTKGISLERMNPDGDTQDAANWSSASSDAGNGTPGYTNSLQGNSSGDSNNPDGDNPNGDNTTPEKTEGIDGPIRDELSDAYVVTYHLNKAGYNYKASIFDANGKELTRLPTGNAGLEGTITWNARQTGSRIPTTGIYIFYVDFFHPEGETRRFKKAFPVR